MRHIIEGSLVHPSHNDTIPDELPTALGCRIPNAGESMNLSALHAFYRLTYVQLYWTYQVCYFCMRHDRGKIPRDASVDVAPLRAPDQMEGHGVIASPGCLRLDWKTCYTGERRTEDVH